MDYQSHSADLSLSSLPPLLPSVIFPGCDVLCHSTYGGRSSVTLSSAAAAPVSLVSFANSTAESTVARASRRQDPSADYRALPTKHVSTRQPPYPSEQISDALAVVLRCELSLPRPLLCETTEAYVVTGWSSCRLTVTFFF